MKNPKKCTQQLKLKDETPFFVTPYPMREEQKKVIQKEMDRLEHLGIICKEQTELQLTGCLSEMEKSKLIPSLK